MTEQFYRPPSPAGRPSRRLASALRRTFLATGGAVAAGLALGAILLVLRYHPKFAVMRVVLAGVPPSRRSEAEALTDRCLGPPLLFVDLDGPVAALSACPWVEKASARRVVPGTVHVTVTSRPPVALARRGGQLWAVDAKGNFLGPHTGRGAAADEDFVVIDPGKEEARGVVRGAALIAQLRRDDRVLADRLSEVEVQPDAFAVIDREIRTRLLLPADAAEPGKAASLWRAFLVLRPELERHSLLRNEADLRFSDRIILKAPADDAARGKT